MPSRHEPRPFFMLLATAVYFAEPDTVFAESVGSGERFAVHAARQDKNSLPIHILVSGFRRNRQGRSESLLVKFTGYEHMLHQLRPITCFQDIFAAQGSDVSGHFCAVREINILNRQAFLNIPIFQHVSQLFLRIH